MIKTKTINRAPPTSSAILLSFEQSGRKFRFIYSNKNGLIRGLRPCGCMLASVIVSKLAFQISASTRYRLTGSRIKPSEKAFHFMKRKKRSIAFHL
jgi:hypothetical protein